MSDDACPWCKYNPYGCIPDDCDFKTLPYEKEAILKRLREEKKNIDKIRDKALDVDLKNATPETMKDMQSMVDISKGMQIMVDRLVADFGMKNDEIYVAVGFDKSKMSWANKMKLTMKLMRMKEKRKGGKDGSKKSGKIPRWSNRRT